MKKLKITAVFGTRPEAVKMCPLVKELQSRNEAELRVVLSGQHRELCREVTDFFGIVPNRDLCVMKEGQSLSELTQRILLGMTDELSEHPADILLVHGDTTTAFAVSLSAFYMGIKVGHVEAGLRTNDLFSPYPEEFNRRGVDAMSFCHFAPTERAAENLIHEGIEPRRVFVTGNTVVDALSYTLSSVPEKNVSEGKLLLVTLHRRESRGEDMRNILRAVKRAAAEASDLRVILPAHPAPEVREAIGEVLTNDMTNITICEPMPLPEFHRMLYEADLILTDSGGIQEEAVSLGRPLLLARDTTERPEGIESGFVTLVGRNEEKIFDAIRNSIEGRSNRLDLPQKNPFGDGNASKKIADILLTLPLEKNAVL